MSQPISAVGYNRITLPLPFGMGSVNCYLLQAGDGHVLIDTGAPNAREVLSRELESLGCQPTLIIAGTPPIFAPHSEAR
jgi:glyoxylase-like metal-dependent hydrolase (beta-lactamase superfamily II)